MARITEEQEDIQLSFRSISAKQGHFGFSTYYIAGEHRVIRRKWGARRRLFGLLPPKQIPQEIQYLDIPDEITTEEAIREYVKQHRPGWLHGSDRKSRTL